MTSSFASLPEDRVLPEQSAVAMSIAMMKTVPIRNDTEITVSVSVIMVRMVPVEGNMAIFVFDPMRTAPAKKDTEITVFVSVAAITLLAWVA